MQMMTLEERERHAYIEGRVEEAALLVIAIDCVEERTLEVQYELDCANEEITRLERRLAE